jgi:hypothetical protein
MRLHPLFKWFGSKWSASKLYPKPEHQIIIEPYAGSAGYSLNYSDRDVYIYDSHPALGKLWPWLIHAATQQLILDIPINLPVGTNIRTIGLSEGQQLLLRMWQRTNNCSDCWTVSKWGSLPGQWTANTRARVAEEVSGIKHWKWGDLGSSWKWSTPATWHIDPPYLYNYRYGCKFDHEDLAVKVSRIASDSLIIVCEATCPKTGQVPSYLPFQPFARRVTSRRKQGNNTHSNELIWTNRQ